MEILSKNKVVVRTSDELYKVLNEENNYIYIYLGDSITLESSVVINKNKEKIILDGTYLTNIYTLTLTNDNDEIVASTTNKKLSIGSYNMNIHPINSGSNKISGHTKSFADVLIEYDNVSYIVRADSDGLFNYEVENNISDNTKIFLTSCVDTSYVFKKEL